VALLIVMNVGCVDGTIRMECQPEQNQGDSPIQTSAREEEHQGSAGLACAQRIPAAGDRGVWSDGASIPVNFSHDHQSATATPET
jgi:hypothetical protein